MTEEADPSEARAAARNAAATGLSNRVTFSRHELNRILNLYGRMVADGEWRDYAIDFLRDRAVFSIFRRAAEVPIYRIEKDPRLARKQGIYSVISAGGLILRRGHDSTGCCWSSIASPRWCSALSLRYRLGAPPARRDYQCVAAARFGVRFASRKERL